MRVDIDKAHAQGRGAVDRPATRLQGGDQLGESGRATGGTPSSSIFVPSEKPPTELQDLEAAQANELPASIFALQSQRTFVTLTKKRPAQ